MMNTQLREYVTSIGFNLTLSKAMIDNLILLHHFKGWHGISSGGFLYHPATKSYVTTARSLQARGLIRLDTDSKLTRAGILVIGLLKQAGIYQDRLAELLDSPERGKTPWDRRKPA
jgi:hypothetical protein